MIGLEQNTRKGRGDSILTSALDQSIVEMLDAPRDDAETIELAVTVSPSGFMCSKERRLQNVVFTS